MVFSATLVNSSVISWCSVLLMEETRVSVSSTRHIRQESTGCDKHRLPIDLCNPNYHAIAVTRAPHQRKFEATTFNSISVISWRSVLFVEETGVTGENHFRLFEMKTY